MLPGLQSIVTRTIHDQLIGAGDALQARGEIDVVADYGQGFAIAAAEHAQGYRAGGHTDTDLQQVDALLASPEIEPLDFVQDLQRRAQAAGGPVGTSFYKSVAGVGSTVPYRDRGRGAQAASL